MTNETTQPDLQILRALAEAVKDWSNCNQAWPHRDPDYEGIAVVGAVDEDGIDWPLAEIDADTYGHDGESLKLAQFYAAANPEVLLSLLDRIYAQQAENERLRAEAGAPPGQSLIAGREVVADGPVRVTRLHLSAEGRAALTSKATGPLPGVGGG